MKVAIIGSGNVATVLGKKILAAGHEITQVVGRNVENVNALSAILNSTGSYNVLEINDFSDIYVISVSDGAITEIAKQLKLKNKLIVHTAAAVSQNVLSSVSKNYGVLYPLQTLRKDVAAAPSIPILVDGASTDIRKLLAEFAAQWAHSVGFATDEERLKLHVAAVIVNNFTNHLFTLTENYCKQEHLNFNMLKPLIDETIARMAVNNPSKIQTGPAVRGDMETVNKHLQLLENHALLKEVYSTLSNSIINYYSKN